MGQNYDDTTGEDRPSIEDLIREAERSGSFEDYLSTKTANSEGKWNTTASQSKSAGGAVENAASSDLSPATPSTSSGSADDASKATALVRETLTRIGEGLGNQPQDVRVESIVLADPDPTPMTNATLAPPEPLLHVSVKNHPMIGTYVTDELISTEGDPKREEVFINALNKGVNEMTWEQVLEVIHANAYEVVLRKEAERGLRGALEHHIAKMNAGDRAMLAEKDKEYRVKAVSRNKPKSEKKASTGISKGGVKPSNPAEKSIHTLVKSLGMTRDEVLENYKERGKTLDDALLGYLNRITASEV